MAAPHILVADDDAWILRMVTTILEKRGYIVDIAHDGKQALDKALTHPPDLLITDVLMPHMNGWAVVKTLRTKPKFAFVPVIFLSALDSEDDRIRGFGLGADAYLPKPFRFEKLELQVRKALEGSQKAENKARQHLAQVSAPASDSATHSVAALSGTLTEVGLSALLTLLDMERKSGILVVKNNTHLIGRLFIRNGHILKAQFDGKDQPTNRECLYAMLSWSRGEFVFNQATVDINDEIQNTTTHLLLESAQRMDEDRAS